MGGEGRCHPVDGRSAHDDRFHETADGIIEAAENKDREGVMTALGDTLNTCTSCHALYKQQVVTDEVWGQKTKMGAPSEDMQKMHHGGG